MYDDDPIRTLNGGKPMGDDYGGLALHEFRQGILDEPFRLSINVGGRLVENQDLGVYG
jgi:hypothetical protein